MTSVTALFSPVEDDLRVLNQNLRQLIGARHPILSAAADRLFQAGGKQLRPAIVLLVSRATVGDGDITPRHRRLAEIAEMIHTASLIHDDVLDESDVRRGIPTVHSSFGNRIAVLAGDFLFAQSSWYLANLDHLEVVKLLSQVIMDLAEGEIQQGLSHFDTDLSLEDYLHKSYYKTGSLIANSSKAAALLSGVSDELAEHIYQFGRNIGLAFQIVDDILDFTESSETLGKPAASDLRSGNLTAPALYAMAKQPQLVSLISREFSEEGDVEQAITLIHESDSISQSRELAAEHTRVAVEHLSHLPPSEAHQCLSRLADYLLSRCY
ncbi:MAG: solanesyl diphosphate synthase [Phormidium sp. GEM2.Bin31]|nr:solanesyl diphosphate synthase [Phormidium sp. BM_Day4_Bin.17]TVR09851.1 MAG: solanesyl diphosphate synthase [Phormidium sp. GEM2.Bin31]UCJ12305.1 MAG: solanesyl diphosphate synthase [Phormidium sp. PBR-2020]